jgi:hypothetical protein
VWDTDLNEGDFNQYVFCRVLQPIIEGNFNEKASVIRSPMPPEAASARKIQPKTPPSASAADQRAAITLLTEECPFYWLSPPLV